MTEPQPTPLHHRLAAFLSAALSNLLGLLGIALLIVAVAHLAGGWWAVLLAGAVLVAFAWALQRQELAEHHVATGAARRLEQMRPRRRAAAA